MSPPKTEEERKATRCAAQRRYYARHREACLARTKAWKDTHSPKSIPYAEKRARETARRLADLKKVVHPSMVPMLTALQELGVAKGLYPSEMTTLEEILTMATAKLGDKPASSGNADPLPASKSAPVAKFPIGGNEWDDDTDIRARLK
jgi:hypothetical protein